MNWFKNIFQINSIDDLKALCEKEKVTLNQDNGFIILSYNQLNSSSHSYFASTCRGLVLDNDLMVVSRPFRRFFNYNENFTDKIIDKFIGKKVSVALKADGSLVKVFHYKNKWYAHSRNSTGKSNVSKGKEIYQISFEDFAKFSLTGKKLSDYADNKDYFKHNKIDTSSFDDDFQKWAEFEQLDKNKTYLFELCSPLNSPIVHYEDVKVYFLGALSNSLNIKNNFPYADLSEQMQSFAKTPNKESIKSYIETACRLFENYLDIDGKTEDHNFKSGYIMSTKTDIVNNIDDISQNVGKERGTKIEGYVVYFDDVPFCKIKNLNYIKLQHIVKKEINEDHLIEIVCCGEEAEVSSYLPQFKVRLDNLATKRDMMVTEINKVADAVVEKMENHKRDIHFNYDEKWKHENRKKECVTYIMEMINPAMNGVIIEILKGFQFQDFKLDKRIYSLKNYLKSI